MGVSKVVYGGETLIDLTSDTVSQENLLDGATATNAMGEKVVGIAKGLPDQTGQSGKVLGTDGTDASWVTVPADDSKLDKSGGTLTGVLRTASKEDGLKIPNSTVTRGTPPPANTYRDIRFVDNGENSLGQIRNWYYADGRVALQFIVNNGTDSKIFAIRSDGKLDLGGKNILREDTLCTTKATTTNPASASNPCVVVETYKNGNDWYRVWSDGWIEQGGYVSNTSGANEKTVTLKKAFTTTDYCVINQYEGATNGGAGAGYNNSIGTRATGSFKMRLDNRSGLWYACGY